MANVGESREPEQGGQTVPPAAAEPVDELERLRAELEEANRKGEEYFSALQRVQADFVNFRRRIDQERIERARFAKAEMVAKLLPVLDDFERATRNVPPDLAESDWGKGILLIERKVRSLLEGEDVTRIEALGKPFDPWEHEAVAYAEVPGVAEGTVAEVLREGYKLYDRVLRPAQVVVAK